MKISLGISIPDLGSLPGSRPGGGGGSTLFSFNSSEFSQVNESDACEETANTARFKSSSSNIPVQVGDVIFREAEGASYIPDGYWVSGINGAWFQVKGDGLVALTGSCSEPISAFDSTTEPAETGENLCEAVPTGSMFKAGTSNLVIGDIIYSNIEGTTLAATGFYRGTGLVYETDDKGNGEIVSISSCA